MGIKYELLAEAMRGASGWCGFLVRDGSKSRFLSKVVGRFLQGGNLLQRLFFILMLAGVVPSSALATSFAWRPAVLTYKAKATALPRVLEDIFVTQYQPIAISDAVKALPTLSGDFSLSPKAFFEHVSKSYGLVSYFDGTTMFVTTLVENQTVVQALTRISVLEVERAARDFGYLDSRFVFRKVDNPPALQLSGPPAYLERISDVIAVLEAGAVGRMQDARMAFRVVPLKHAWAEDITYSVGGREVVITGVANSLRKLVGDIGGLGGFESENVSEKVKLTQPYKPANAESRPSSLLGRILPGDSNLEQANAKNILPRQEKQGKEQIGKYSHASARIVGDSRMNAVVIMAPLEMLAMLEDVVRQLDVEPELIQIEATVMDVQNGLLKELGFDWSLTGNNFQVATSNSGGGIGENLNGSARSGNSAPNISIFGGSVANNFLSRITALQTTGKTNILSQPKLATLNGIEAILSNQEVFYPEVRSERSVQLYQVEVGLLMRVVPIVVGRANAKPDIRLRIFIEDGGIGNQTVGGLPTTSKSSISTQAIVKDGESLLIGGYVKEGDRNSETKVPLLGDIPGLGALFRYRTNNADRQERLYLITPKLLRGAELAVDTAAKAGEQGGDAMIPSSQDDAEATAVQHPEIAVDEGRGRS